MKRTLLLVLLVLVAGCAAHAGQRRSDTDSSWHLGFGAPAYMEMWVETARVEDVRGRVFPNSGSGTVSINYAGDPAGWPKNPGRGAGRAVTGADLPARIYIRWQSLVEPQTYEATLELPERLRALMRQREPMPLYLPERRLVPRNYVIVGLAPGGVVKVWNGGTGLEAVEVMCVQATVVAEGPDRGRYGGRYVTLPPEPRAYLDTNPIPYASWRCDGTAEP